MNINKIIGLSSREVSNRQKKFGYNELPNKDGKNLAKIAFDILTEPMIFLLMATVAIYFVLGSGDEASLLLLSFLGIIGIELRQDLKTEKSLQALRNLSSPISTVIRNGKRVTIPGREVVVGDIIILAEGARVPADAELISSEGLRVDESLLTGESEPVEKHTRSVTDYRVNSVFSGTLVVKGHAVAEVIKIGAETEIGKIGVSLKSIATEKTLLQKDVAKVIKFVATLAISLSILLTLVFWLTRGDLLNGLLAGLTLSIAILPEEFPLVLTIFLTLGAWRLAKNHVLTRRTQTIETLGSATVLCVDKTGTLTENRMKISEVADRDGKIFNDDFSEASEVIKYGVLASQRDPYDPMEEAFILAGKNAFGNVDKIYGTQTIVKEYPLDDGILSVVHVWGGAGKAAQRVALKGAPEAVFELCCLDDDSRYRFEKTAKDLARRGLRVIAVAKAESQDKFPDDRRDFDFEFLGLVGLVDPIRKEVPQAIETCHEAGIRVVMITGDYPETAMNIASQIGLSDAGVITGAEFERLSEKERHEIVKNIAVFSRVSPANKLTIVEALKKSGEIVAMTGDGVNDAPALKSAHVGIAMGKRGTDVAREAASIVLLDDNFASIVKGVSLGRRIFDNLRKAMSYIISVHIPIAALSLVPVLFKWPIVLMPAHIVFLEFIIDPSCTVIFENEKESCNIMKRPPRKLKEPIFNRKMVISNLLRGSIVAVVVVLAFGLLINFGWTENEARSITFLILILSNIFQILALSGKQAFSDIFHLENKSMLTLLLVTVISLLLIFNVSFLRNLFHFEHLSMLDALVSVAIAAVATLGILPFKKAN